MIFMNNPISSFPRKTSLVENKSLLSSNNISSVTILNVPFFTGDFPIAPFGCPIGASAVRILVISRTKEKEFRVVQIIQLPFWNSSYLIKKKEKIYRMWERTTTIQIYKHLAKKSKNEKKKKNPTKKRPTLISPIIKK